MNRKHIAKRTQQTKKWLKKHKNYVLALSTTIVVVMLLGSTLLTREITNTIERTDPSGSGVASVPQITFEQSPLTGVDVDPELTKLPVTAVIIENSPEARPQSGLAEAGIVYETSAEGGITRFLALYQESVPSIIGPVRSLRPYFNDWVVQYDAVIAHVGGSTQALAEVGPRGLKDLDEFKYSSAYWRDSSRYAPHNAYTSGENLAGLKDTLGFSSSSFTPIKRKAESAASEPTATKISVDISGYTYNPVFSYNKAKNAYDRSVAGAPHKDRESGQQIAPKSVVVLQMNHQVLNDVGHLKINTIGSNKAWVFQDGIVTKATWNRSNEKAQIDLKDEAGKAIALNKGQSWFTIMPAGNNVAY